jgi:hypothetical protein
MDHTPPKGMAARSSNNINSIGNVAVDSFDVVAEMSSNSLAIAIDLNNRGCVLLSGAGEEEEEDEQFVLEMFNSAIDQLKIHATVATVPSDVANANALASSFETRTLQCSPIIPSSTTTNTTTSNTSLDSALSDIVDRPVLIGEHNPCSTELYPLYAGCILFNMAIAYHRMAFKVSQSRLQNLAKAQGLYQVVFSSLASTGLHDDTTLGLCTLTLNNMAEIYRTEGRYEHLTGVVRQLKPLVSHQQQQRLLERRRREAGGGGENATENYHLISGRDLDRITLNLMMIWKVPQLAAAA